ncbi:hypothetical protein [Desulfosporosinus fructosivorans]
MNENILITNHVKKVNKVFVISFWGYSLSIFLALLLTGQLAFNALPQVVTLVLALIATVLLFMKDFEIKVGYFVVFAFTLVAMLALAANGGRAFLIVFLPLCIAAAYTLKRIYLFGGILTSLGVILVQLLKNMMAQPDFIPHFVILEVVVVILFFLTKWGSEMINTALTARMQVVL